ncbi:EscD/YscD/HrpQ family type III secretion system inner membrane ring protein [Vibrio alginolyticus]|uniref:type III secretion system inner membrane ring subunit SctD n=1 Tax=Vibrio alginolyticus TaxID=663 RepID=UPI001BD37491|nr:type III secretion system inner membrane ring subunit SctD [Vibrio alginolyticus]EGQ8448881.1 EscD/YscD/HrpQ family type III secretion system inner membrane ring protein [Vibrio alginolyticus]EGQ9716243.1 EscD/YscD/HrpQ family type III secretion system inner membrane ring protein [Vibrio alginolyticus]EGR0197593.1 EscD/YscD/HrpQ family type III secretion system inner membrane ring protein [Vibrio alginolyticus]EGR2552246.1 EscD/YscD/HrpQ family type III secretion system inner membrane ring p
MQQWKIRILSGVHTGVEVTLPEGVLVLGSDDFIADLVLSDAGVEANHFALVCQQDSVILRGCEEANINSEDIAVAGDGIELSRHAVVSVGVVKFALGYAEDALIVSNVSDESSQQNTPVVAVQRSSWKKTTLIALLCSFVPSVIFAGMWYSQANGNNNEIVTEAEPIVLVRNILGELKLSDVRVEWNAAARQAVLEGYVEDRTQKLDLLGRIDVLGINYKSDLRTMEEIRRGVRFILRNLGYHQVKVENGDETGTLLLTGYIDDASRWNQVEQILERDVPGLIAWKVELQRAGAYMDTLKALLTDAELLKKVQLVTSGDRIEVRGELDDIETTRFYGVTRDFREQYGEKPYLVLKSIPKVSKGTNIDFPFRSVNFGQVPYVILTDNVRYMVGARTPQGYRISSVTPAGIELVKGGRVITIELGYEGETNNDKS